jgi:hypothetical protein
MGVVPQGLSTVVKKFILVPRPEPFEQVLQSICNVAPLTPDEYKKIALTEKAKAPEIEFETILRQDFPGIYQHYQKLWQQKYEMDSAKPYNCQLAAVKLALTEHLNQLKKALQAVQKDVKSTPPEKQDLKLRNQFNSAKQLMKSVQNAEALGESSPPVNEDSINFNNLLDY